MSAFRWGETQSSPDFSLESPKSGLERTLAPPCETSSSQGRQHAGSSSRARGDAVSASRTCGMADGPAR